MNHITCNKCGQEKPEYDYPHYNTGPRAGQRNGCVCMDCRAADSLRAYNLKRHKKLTRTGQIQRAWNGLYS